MVLTVALFISGCGTEYTYKPVSYMTQNKTYSQAEAYCKSSSSRESGKLYRADQDRANKQYTKKRADRIYKQSLVPPTYTAKTNCHKYGNYFDCKTVSTPNISEKSNPGYNSDELMGKGISRLGNLISKGIRKRKLFESCMSNEGYKKVKVTKKSVNSRSNNSTKPSSITSNTTKYPISNCTESSPWSKVFECKYRGRKYFGKGVSISKYFYPDGHPNIPTIKPNKINKSIFKSHSKNIKANKSNYSKDLDKIISLFESGLINKSEFKNMKRRLKKRQNSSEATQIKKEIQKPLKNNSKRGNKDGPVKGGGRYVNGVFTFP